MLYNILDSLISFIRYFYKHYNSDYIQFEALVIELFQMINL